MVLFSVLELKKSNNFVLIIIFYFRHYPRKRGYPKQLQPVPHQDHSVEGDHLRG